MQLIIKQYLSLLKESQELDKLLPDLLLTMGIEPISRPQIGPRQYGVDVAAVGKDENGEKTFFIFTIKQGDIGRSDWDGTPQSVRTSLNEIKDVYIPTHIEKKYKGLPKKIVLCTGGEKKQEITQNWSQFVNSSQVDGKLTYDFWGGDTLSLLIEKHLFNETIIPTELQTSLRKVLALVGDPDYDLSHYQRILDGLFSETDFGDVKKASAQKKILKAFRIINLCQNIIYKWASDEGNLNPAIYCSEKTVLYGWDFIRKHDLHKNDKIGDVFFELYQTLYLIYIDYFNKVQGHCHIRDGFCGYGEHHIQENLNIFKHLGFLSTAGLICLFQALASKSLSEYSASIQNISGTLKAFMKNHKATALPVYDEHIIEISEAILFLCAIGEKDFVHDWINQMINHLVFAYNNMGKYFPIHSDSFDDLVELNISGEVEKEKLFEMSTLVPILAHWCITLNFNETYDEIQKIVTEFFPQCTLQIWYPDNETDEQLYIRNASRTGAMDAPTQLHEDIEEMKKRINQLQKNTIKFEDISAIKNGFTILPIIASRHFRTPFMPFYWQLPLLNESKV